MGKQCPETLQWVLEVLVGLRWPEADEDQLRALAGRWTQLGEQVEQAGQAAGPAAGALISDNEGASVEAFAQAWQKMAAQHIPQAQQLCGDLAASLDQYAGDVEATKEFIVVQLGILVAEIGLGLAGTVFTFGVSDAVADAAVVATRLVLRRAASELVEKAVAAGARLAVKGAADGILNDGLLQTLRAAHGGPGFNLTELAGAGAAGGAGGLVGGKFAEHLPGSTHLAAQVVGHTGAGLAGNAAAGLAQTAVTGQPMTVDALLGGVARGGLAAGAYRGVSRGQHHHADQPDFLPRSDAGSPAGRTRPAPPSPTSRQSISDALDGRPDGHLDQDRQRAPKAAPGVQDSGAASDGPIWAESRSSGGSRHQGPSEPSSAPDRADVPRAGSGAPRDLPAARSGPAEDSADRVGPAAAHPPIANDPRPSRDQFSDGGEDRAVLDTARVRPEAADLGSGQPHPDLDRQSLASGGQGSHHEATGTPGREASGDTRPVPASASPPARHAAASPAAAVDHAAATRLETEVAPAQSPGSTEVGADLALGGSSSPMDAHLASGDTSAPGPTIGRPDLDPGAAPGPDPRGLRAAQDRPHTPSSAREAGPGRAAAHLDGGGGFGEPAPETRSRPHLDHDSGQRTEPEPGRDQNGPPPPHDRDSFSASAEGPPPLRPDPAAPFAPDRERAVGEIAQLLDVEPSSVAGQALAATYDVARLHSAPFITKIAHDMLPDLHADIEGHPGQVVAFVGRDGRSLAIATRALDPNFYEQHCVEITLSRASVESALQDLAAQTGQTFPELDHFRDAMNKVDPTTIPGSWLRLTRYLESSGIPIQGTSPRITLVDTSYKGTVQILLGGIFPHATFQGRYAFFAESPHDPQPGRKTGYILNLSGPEANNGKPHAEHLPTEVDRTFSHSSALASIEDTLQGPGTSPKGFDDDGPISKPQRTDPRPTAGLNPIRVHPSLADPLIREGVKHLNLLAVQDVATRVAQLRAAGEPIGPLLDEQASQYTDTVRRWITGDNPDPGFKAVADSFVRSVDKRAVNDLSAILEVEGFNRQEVGSIWRQFDQLTSLADKQAFVAQLRSDIEQGGDGHG